ncbi:MAG TPA: hypothetical protein VGL77_14140 [Armatimonadota bacterium]
MRSSAKGKPDKVWMQSPPGSGGVIIPPDVQAKTREHIEQYAADHYAGKYIRLDIRFRGIFCYIAAYTEPPPYYPSPSFPETKEEYRERMMSTPAPICRLRYHGKRDRWDMAFYKYSDEKYELSVLNTGTFFGTPEEGFDTAAQVYLN